MIGFRTGRPCESRGPAGFRRSNDDLFGLVGNPDLRLAFRARTFLTRKFIADIETSMALGTSYTNRHDGLLEDGVRNLWR